MSKKATEAKRWGDLRMLALIARARKREAIGFHQVKNKETAGTAEPDEQKSHRSEAMGRFANADADCESA